MYKTSKNLDKSAFLTGGGSLTSRTLLAALLLGVTPAMAAELADVDLSKIPLNKPTLDYLHENNVQIPQYEISDYEPPVETGSIPAPESAYTMIKVDTAGKNTINSYEWNSEQNSLSPVYYQLDLKQKDYGYKTDNNTAETITVNTPNAANTASAFEYAINYYVNKDRLAPDRITTTDQQVTDINYDFVGLKGENYSGGAIYSYNDKIGVITGDFINNGIVNGSTLQDGGGAIFNDNSRIESINGNFIGNYAYSVDSIGGGAIYTYDHNMRKGSIGDITGDFIGNHAISEESYVSGGAIDNTYYSYIENITGNFIGNYASGADGASGGAISTQGELSSITGDFIGNYVQSKEGYAEGGAIYGGIPNIAGDFIGNYAVTENGEVGGGAIREIFGLAGFNLFSIRGNFIGNYVLTKKGDAVGGAILSNQFICPTNIINSSFFNNTAIAENGNAFGGAIITSARLNITADNGYSIFSGNKTISGDKEEQNAIAVYGAYSLDLSEWDSDLSGSGFLDPLTLAVTDKNSASITLKAVNNGTIIFDDTIRGGGYDFMQNGYMIQSVRGDILIETPETAYDLTITGDETGKVILNNDIINANIALDTTNLYLGRENVFDQSQLLTLNSGNLYLNNNAVGTMHIPTFSLNGNTNISVDVDLANQTMDRITADSYNINNPDANLNVNNITLLSDATQNITPVLFADKELANNVQYTGASPIAYSPIYKYNVGYETREDDGGYFIFTRGDIVPDTPGGTPGGGTTGNPSDAFNPAVLATPVGNLAAGQAAVNEAFKYVFEHADAFTQLPAMERYAKINANKYALSTDFNDNLPSYADNLHNKGVWFRPYTTFETMNIKNGPKVDAITYGSLVGFDGDFKEMKNGWSRVFTGYAGYMGSSLNYSGVDTTMNGGLLGFTETFYKGNFWTAITASAGASVGESHTMYGKEDYTSLLAGVGSKTGYNFEFKDGKFIIQPIMFLSYTFVNTFDYKNAAGVNIESDPLHTIQLNPSVRFIANLKGGWQPYASVGMVWNLMNESKVTANNVKLPEMSVKPYVEYGVGVQRNWADKFTAFLQAMIRNGGRNGVALTGGFRFMLGSDSKNSDKPKVKKEIKSL